MQYDTVLAGIAGAAVGATATAFVDWRGARRRGELGQRARHAVKEVEGFGGKAARDLAHRSRGRLASLASLFRHDEPSPEVLVERVRASLGRLTSHPSAIEVQAREQGVVQLSGPVLAAEADHVVKGVGRVRGVHEIVDRLERHETPGRVPSLQGGAGRPAAAPELLQRSWAPGTRAVALVCGASAATWGVRRRGIVGLVAGGAGLLLAARAVSNLELKRILGVGAGRRAIDLRKTITIAAPRQEVFAFFSAFENFPRFMTHVRDVRRTSEGRWHWTVSGPAGSTVEWDAEVSAFAANEMIAWKTVSGAPVESSGIVRFEDELGRTRLDVRLSYNPVAGALGHAVAALFGADPKRQMDDDLLRLKSLLERGKAERVTREEVAPDRSGA
jgi:uncharacterized membrane protein